MKNKMQSQERKNEKKNEKKIFFLMETFFNTLHYLFVVVVVFTCTASQ